MRSQSKNLWRYVSVKILNHYLISVIIPAYNHEQYVRQAIQSIIDQDYQNIELLIVDDGSKDKTFSVIQEMRSACEKRFTRFVCETQQNQGTCVTLNRLLAMAQGEFVYLIASDDMAKPNAISTLLNEFQSDDIVLAVGDNEFIDERGIRIGWSEQCETQELQNAAYKSFAPFLHISELGPHFGEYRTFLTRNYIPNGYLIRKSALEKMGAFTKEAPLEDHYMHLQLSKIGKYRFVNQILFSYRWHSVNSVQQHQKMVQYLLKTLRFEEVRLKKKYTQFLPFFHAVLNEEKITFHLPFFKVMKKSSIADNTKTKFIVLFGHKIRLSSRALIK